MERVRKLIAAGLATLLAASAWGLSATKETFGFFESRHRGPDGEVITLQTSSGRRTLTVPAAGKADFTDARGNASNLQALEPGDWLRVDFVAEGAGTRHEHDWVSRVQTLSHGKLPSPAPAPSP